jgi:hypothetical protein
MFVQEEGSENGSLRRKLSLGIAIAIAIFLLYKAYGIHLQRAEESEKSKAINTEIEEFWGNAKRIADDVNLEAESYIAINRLTPNEPLSPELFHSKSCEILKEIDGPEEQVIRWEATTTGELKVKLVGRLYLSAQAPPEGGSYAYAILEMIGGGEEGDTIPKKYHPQDDLVRQKEERIKKIENKEALPPIGY